MWSTLVHRRGEISLLLCRFAPRSTIDEPTAHDICRVSVSLPYIGLCPQSAHWIFRGWRRAVWQSLGNAWLRIVVMKPLAATGSLLHQLSCRRSAKSPAEHTESVMQREFSATNKLRTGKKLLILLCKTQRERWRSRHDSNMRPTV